MTELKPLKGTTTVGLKCSDGILLAADKRATMGYLVANKEVDKIFQIDNRMGLTVAGVVSDAQELARIMRAQIELYKVEREKEMGVEAASVLLSNILHGNRFFPYYVQLILGGYDTEPRLYTLDPFGGLTDEEVTSTGSGSPLAYGVLEDLYSKNKTVAENISTAVRALSSAMKRDIATGAPGEGIDVVSITKSGFKRHSKEEIESYRKKK